MKYAEEGQKPRHMPIRWKNIKDTAKPERPGWKSGKGEGPPFWDRDETGTRALYSLGEMAFLVLRMKLPITMACPVFSHAFGRDTVSWGPGNRRSPRRGKEKSGENAALPS